jgi:uncharacterized protein (DUF952 family)
MRPDPRNDVIYHITGKADWNKALTGGRYVPASFADEGFIHCSTADQVIATANRIFRGQRDRVLLCVAVGRINAPVRHENLEGGAERYPHIYGVLNLDAVVAVHNFPPLANGCFELPAALNVSAADGRHDPIG